eukprot:9452019-Alexandrium_andersonii.AAC.1
MDLKTTPGVPAVIPQRSPPYGAHAGWWTERTAACCCTEHRKVASGEGCLRTLRITPKRP